MSGWPDYVDKNNKVYMCKICRSVKNIRNPQEWTIISTWYVTPPENTSFVIRPKCT